VRALHFERRTRRLDALRQEIAEQLACAVANGAAS
jgi:hypothetical protein